MGNRAGGVRTDEEKELEAEFAFVPQENILPSIYSRFKRVRVLGEGATCKVIQCTSRSTHSQVALKKMNRSDEQNAKIFCREYGILRKLVHPGILSFRAVFIDQKSFCIVTELCTGGRLLDRVRQEKYMSERKVCIIIKQLLSAVQFMHQHSIVHRDLKPENILYDRVGTDSHIVIIDFGLAREIADPNEMYEDFAGTEEFMAPEIISPRPAGVMKKSDMWSIGVIMYLLVTGRLPFQAATRRELFKKICQKNCSWPDDIDISRDCRHFVRGLLKRQHETRMTADEALLDEWIQISGPSTDHDLGKSVLEHVATYKSGPRLKQLLVDVAVAEMGPAEKQVIASAFEDITHEPDSNEGFDVDILYEYFMRNGWSPQMARCRAESFFDRFGSAAGRLTFDDFIRMHAADQIADDHYLINAFQQMDRDHDGLISTDDLHGSLESIISNTLSREMVESVLDECTTDWGARSKPASPKMEHQMSFDEFAYAMKKLDSGPDRDAMMSGAEFQWVLGQLTPNGT